MQEQLFLLCIFISLLCGGFFGLGFMENLIPDEWFDRFIAFISAEKKDACENSTDIKQ